MPPSLDLYFEELLAPALPLEASGPWLLWKRLLDRPDWQEIRDANGYAPVLLVLLTEPVLLKKVIKDYPEALASVDKQGHSLWPYALGTPLLKEVLYGLFAWRETTAPNDRQHLMETFVQKVPWHVTREGEGPLAQLLFLEKHVDEVYLQAKAKKGHKDAVYQAYETAHFVKEKIQARLKSSHAHQDSLVYFYTNEEREKADLFWHELHTRHGYTHTFALSPDTEYALSNAQALSPSQPRYKRHPLECLSDHSVRTIAPLLSHLPSALAVPWRHALLCETIRRWIEEGETCTTCNPGTNLPPKTWVTGPRPCCGEAWRGVVQTLLTTQGVPCVASLDVVEDVLCHHDASLPGPTEASKRQQKLRPPPLRRHWLPPSLLLCLRPYAEQRVLTAILQEDEGAAERSKGRRQRV